MWLGRYSDGAAESPGRTRSSSARELMPSLRNTLRKWYWTVRGLMNSWAPISGFVRLSRASTTFWVMESIRLDLGYGSQVHP